MTDDWRILAACKNMGTALFFPDAHCDHGPAKKVCAACPVSAQCLDYALNRGEAHGVWGGQTERGRRRIKRQRQYERRVARDGR